MMFSMHYLRPFKTSTMAKSQIVLFKSGCDTRVSIVQEVSAAAIKKTISLVNPSYLLVYYERVTKL